MTDAELAQRAHGWLTGGVTAAVDIDAILRRFLTLLADQEGRGEVVSGCPDCGCFEYHGCGGIKGLNQCDACDQVFVEPAYYQRIPSPPQEPKA